MLNPLNFLIHLKNATEHLPLSSVYMSIMLMCAWATIWDKRVDRPTDRHTDRQTDGHRTRRDINLGQIWTEALISDNWRRSIATKGPVYALYRYTMYSTYSSAGKKKPHKHDFWVRISRFKAAAATTTTKEYGNDLCFEIYLQKWKHYFFFFSRRKKIRNDRRRHQNTSAYFFAPRSLVRRWVGSHHYHATPIFNENGQVSWLLLGRTKAYDPFCEHW